jgi:hypothetical protein
MPYRLKYRCPTCGLHGTTEVLHLAREVSRLREVGHKDHAHLIVTERVPLIGVRVTLLDARRSPIDIYERWLAPGDPHTTLMPVGPLPDDGMPHTIAGGLIVWGMTVEVLE